MTDTQTIRAGEELNAENIREFLRKENISRFDVAGFSMGGRFALATLEAFPEKIGNVFLIAPDGEKQSRRRHRLR